MTEVTSAAFRQFLIDYKKTLPHNEENKDFREHIDFMIEYFKPTHSFYRSDWGCLIYLGDEKYWRSPNEEEKRKIRKRDIEENNKKKLS